MNRLQENDNSLICTCEYPFKVRVCDVVVSSPEHLFDDYFHVIMRRYLDCIFHGPQSHLLDIITTTDLGVGEVYR